MTYLSAKALRISRSRDPGAGRSRPGLGEDRIVTFYNQFVARERARRPQSGAPLWLPVLAFTVLTVIGVAVNRSTPHPDASGAAVLGYNAAHTTTVKIGSWLLFASAVPLTIATAVIYRRLRALGITAPGSAIALAGGLIDPATARTVAAGIVRSS
jgi:hypothetical protein